MLNEFHLMKTEVKTGIKLTKLQKKLAELGIKVYLGKHSKPGWRGDLPFYACKCSEHGVYVTYPQGYLKRLSCPMCL